jgi:hypothetical protein
MTARTIAAIGIGVAVLVGLAASAEAKRYRARYAGTSVVTSIDSNDDGYPARENISQAKTNLGGRGTVRSVSEYNPPVPAGPGECEGLDLGEGPILRLTLVSDEGATTLQDGSQRFVRGDSGFNCVNATTGEFAGQAEYTVLGGTGRWAGWTGTYTSKFRGQVLNQASSINGFTGESTGEWTKAK